MSTTAQSRDLSDRRTITTFASTVQTPRAAEAAAGPDHLRHPGGRSGRVERLEGPAPAHAVLGDRDRARRRPFGHRAQDPGRPARRTSCGRALPAWSDAEFEAYAARHYPAYWLKVDLPRKVRARANCCSAAAPARRSLATEVATDAFRGVTELTVLAPDHPRLLSIIAGACAAAGANIVDAQIFTTTDGLALDTIFVSRAFDLDEDELRRAGRDRERDREGAARRDPGRAISWRRARLPRRIVRRPLRLPPT